MKPDASVPPLRNALDSLPLNIVVLDGDGRVIEYNTAWEEFASRYGSGDSKTVEGTSYLSLVDEEECWISDPAAKGIRDVIEGSEDTFELDYPCHDDSELRWLRLHAERFEKEGEQFITVTHSDITESKLTELESHLQELLIDQQQGVGIVFDDSGEIILADSRLEDLTGIQKSAFIGRSYDDPPTTLVDQIDSVEEIMAMVGEVIEGELHFASTETTFRPLDGGEMTVVIQIIPHQIDEFTEGAILTGMDVTGLQARRDTLRLYERAIEGSTELLAAVDTEYQFLFANNAYREFFDVPDDDDVSLFDVIGGENREEVERMVERVFDGETIEYTQERTGAEGKTHPFGLRYYPLRNRDGTVIGAVAAIRDLTEQKEREKQLLVLDRVLRHNMHNDMNVISGNAQLIESEASGRVQAHAETIYDTADALLRTVDKQREIIELLIDPDRIQNIDICNIVDSVADAVSERFPEATVDINTPERLLARTIPQIEVAVDELLGNAVKHSETDKPEVTVVVEDLDNGVSITVVDDGPGIPAEELGVLTGEREIEPLYHGSGMGLWLVNWIVSQSDGELEFEENDPWGSRVSIRLRKGIEEVSVQ